MKTKIFTLQLTVEAPATTGERDIEDGINGALDEPPCEWGLWTVGGVEIIKVTRSSRDEEA